ncbi:hypothetical protein [Leptospira noguchii]|nr:hypothetical protein [Leptospira noguchii]
MSCHPKLGKTHATLYQTQRLTSIGARQIALNSAERSLWIAF